MHEPKKSRGLNSSKRSTLSPSDQTVGPWKPTILSPTLVPEFRQVMRDVEVRGYKHRQRELAVDAHGYLRVPT